VTELERKAAGITSSQKLIPGDTDTANITKSGIRLLISFSDRASQHHPYLLECRQQLIEIFEIFWAIRIHKGQPATSFVIL
jgi:hypothetical protein